MDRESLHKLVDRIPETGIPAARRFLEYLAVSPAFHPAQMAPEDVKRSLPVMRPQSHARNATSNWVRLQATKTSSANSGCGEVHLA